jgi:hypothetical protein
MWFRLNAGRWAASMLVSGAKLGAEVVSFPQSAKLWPLAKLRRRSERPDLVSLVLAGRLRPGRARTAAG